MLTFCPSMWLSSVDLPTLGRPTMATKPHRLTDLDVSDIARPLNFPRGKIGGYGPAAGPDRFSRRRLFYTAGARCCPATPRLAGPAGWRSFHGAARPAVVG